MNCFDFNLQFTKTFFIEKQYKADISIICFKDLYIYLYITMADMNQTQSELLKILDSHDLLRTHHMEKASGSG